jgi:hypothetical protein
VSRLLATQLAGPRSWRQVRGPLAGFLAFGLGVGALAGILWSRLVDLPTYKVGGDGGATTSERGLTAFVGGDAWFCLLGAVAGLGLGLLAWRRFRSIGWPVVLVSVLTASAAALVCWLVGTRIGPENFNERLAAAQPNDLVPISLALRAKASLLVWPFLAVVPVLVGSSLGADDEEDVRPEPGATSVGDGS